MALDKDMRRMRQEAIDRVQEMQRQQKQSAAPPSAPPGGQNSNTECNIEEKNTQGIESMPSSDALGGLFDGLMADRERTMILILILLLFTEEADLGVIFSLLYMIL